MSLNHIKSTEIKELLAFLLVTKSRDSAVFNKELGEYLDNIFRTLDAENRFKQSFLDFLNNIFFTDSLTNAGINSNRGFFPELKQRLKHKILPAISKENYLSDFVKNTFNSKTDYLVFEKISHENFSRLFNIVLDDENTRKKLLAQLENALIILAHRLVSIGIDPYLVSKLSFTDDSDSPFFKFNISLNNYIRKIGSIEEVFLHLNRCEEVFSYLSANRETIGISLHLTFLIRRAEQHIKRIRLLLSVHSSGEGEERIKQLQLLVVTILKSELNNTGIRSFFRENTDLVANRVANQTSAKGGHYIGFTRKESSKLFKSAMGGGLIVVFLVYIKNYIHDMHLALMPEGLLFGLNYGLGFVAMHLLHFTLATKQPAMTASYIAGIIEKKINDENARAEISLVLAQIMRSQFISLVGNLVVVLPLCFLVAFMLSCFFNYQIFNEAEALKQLTSNHPLYSGSLIFAVVTGIYLTLAGLITGYYDNKVVFSRVPERIVKHPVLSKLFQKKSLTSFAGFIEKNLGSLVGNMALGFFLGVTGNFGKFMGIPVDIRHITISAGNFGIATAQGYYIDTNFIITVFAGVLLIGIINIISSFLFSFYIACRSRYLHNKQILFMFLQMLLYILKNPASLLLSIEDGKKQEGSV